MDQETNGRSAHPRSNDIGAAWVFHNTGMGCLRSALVGIRISEVSLGSVSR